MANKKGKINSIKVNKKKMLNRLLLLIILTIIAIFMIYKIVSLIISPTEIFVIKQDTIFSEESAIGYVIREEKTVKGKNYQNGIKQIKSEGEKVAKNDAIFRYCSENEEKLNQKIDEINKKIQEAVLGQNNLIPSDIKAIEEQIENKIDGLNQKNDIQEIAEYKNDINTYITKKSKIAGELSKAGSYINGLIKEKEKYQEELKNKSEYISAPISGVVSYRVDGLEDELSPENIENLSKNYIEDLGLNTGQIVETSNEMGKVINNYECYIATTLNSKIAKEVKEGDKVKIVLSTKDEIPAIIYKITEQTDKSVLIVFKINNCVEKLIDYRKISFDIIWWKYEGLKIPKAAIIYENGLSYIVRNRAGYQDKILVKILKENENYCIIDNYDNEDLRNLGYSTNEIKNMKKISIYDEVLLSPEIKEKT